MFHACYGCMFSVQILFEFKYELDYLCWWKACCHSWQSLVSLLNYRSWSQWKDTYGGIRFGEQFPTWRMKGKIVERNEIVESQFPLLAA